MSLLTPTIADADSATATVLVLILLLLLAMVENSARKLSKNHGQSDRPPSKGGSQKIQIVGPNGPNGGAQRAP